MMATANNPYAIKKAAPALFLQPLEDFDDFEPETPPQEDDNQKDFERQQEGALLTNDPSRKSSSTEDGSRDEFQIQQQKEQSEEEEEPTQSAIAPMSVSLPLWKRLPSNAVSIGSAEILSVSEVARHGQLYKNRSVRTTGALRGKHYHEETGEMSLALQDPLCQLSSSGTATATATATAQTAKKAASKGRRISFGHTNESSTTSTKKRRPSLGMTGNRTIISSGSTPGGAKTPLGSAKSAAPQTPCTNTTPGMLQRRGPTPKFRTPGLTRKRPLSSTPKTPQSNTIITTLTQEPRDCTVWVVCNPEHVPVNSLSLGDLVTVCGVVHVHTTTNDTASRPQDNDEKSGENATGASYAVRQLGDRVLEQLYQLPGNYPTAATTANRSSDDSCRKDTLLLFLQARILRQDNGANMRLQQEALQLRRRHILQTVYNPNDDDHHLPQKKHPDNEKSDNKVVDEGGSLEDSTKVLPGCGPPPYPRRKKDALV